MLVDVEDSDAEEEDSLSQHSTDASVSPSANFDDSLVADAPPGGDLSTERSFACSIDAKEKCEHADKLTPSFIASITLCRVLHSSRPTQKVSHYRIIVKSY